MPFDDIEISRYMPMPQFVSMLCNGMFIPKATLFDDPIEGLARLMFEGIPSEKDQIEWAKEWTYVSCWYKSFEESMAMWNIYGKYSEAIAIHTTTKRLIDHIEQDKQFKPYAKKINFVTYMDSKMYPKALFSSELDGRSNRYKRYIFDGLLEEFFFKHRVYEHENEIRLCVVDKSPLKPLEKNPKEGVLIKDAINCIDMITLAPYSPDWYAETIRDIVRKYGSNIPVRKSELDWSKDAFDPANIYF